MTRKAFAIVAVSLVLGCKHDEARCAKCGMKLDAKSAWNAEIDEGESVRRFDTPRCALSTWLADGKKGTVRVEDYYDRTLRPASELRFVVGSDVVGPMGPELVPVDESRVTKFEKDHGGTRALGLAELDEKALAP